ncbi:concanavalin A-like lectin/glucanase domain-containing protein [Clohesyomyces aquaticus]|uniref:Concanavalin A-like lectin/glucanase domain-containing protein n=1 Tax=Clohesyomyces aquaticus TaxID=1231657 RepID=A0A1Y1ZZ79_9PLEO|nr:concanavalin A-like lectin/glucanase domain-containing protein [Clohesyomyces aquaticus]
MMRLSPVGSLLLPLTLLLQPTLSEYTTSNSTTPHDNSQNCSCYVIESGANSNTPEYFQYYRFFDFRNFADKAGQFTKTPPAVNDSASAGLKPVWDKDQLTTDAWNVDWGIQNWSKPATSDFPTPMANSPANVYILQNEDSNDPFTFLTLRTNRLDDSQTAAEIENEQKNVMHCSMRMLARVKGSKGAVAGFFTFFDDTNESDIEILTDDPTHKIRYTNQPAVDKKGNEVQSASVAPDNLAPWDEWQTHRIDWLDKNSYWFLNDKQVAANTYSVPRKPSGVVINMWSDGGEWSGNMSVGDSAEFQIQWIELAFNTSGPVGGPGGGNKKREALDLEGGTQLDTVEPMMGRDMNEWKRKSKGCEVVCKIDGVKQIGTPEVVSVNKSAATDISVSWGLLLFVGIVSTLVGM